MKILSLFLVSCTIGIILADQVLVIPSSTLGLSMGATDPVLHLEAYYDLACPYSSASFIDLMPALNQISIMNNTRVKFTVHLLSLPLHFNSFLMTKGLKYIQANSNTQQEIWDYINLMFHNQTPFIGYNTANYTILQIAANLTNLVTNTSQFNKYSFESFNNSLFDPAIATAALFEIQTSQYRQVLATPSYYVNDYYFNNGGDYNTKQWLDFFNEHA